MGLYEIAVVAALLYAPLWIVSLVDALAGRFSTRAYQLAWVVVVAFVPLGCIAYLIFGRRNVVSGGLGFLHRG
jgi:hypothetical protein